MEVASYMPYQHRTFQPNYHPYYASYQDPRAHTSHPVSMGSTNASQYAHESRRNERAVNAASPQASHVSEEANKPSLPSISKLLGIAADGERTTVPHQDNAATVSQQQQQSYYNAVQTDLTSMPTYSSSLDHAMPQRTAIAPTPPPLRSDSVLDSANSPSAVSQSSISAANYFMGASLNNVDPHQQRMASLLKRHQQSASMYATSSTAMPHYSLSPSAMSTSSYFSTDGVYPVSGLYHQQRPLPSNFPPAMSGPLVSAPGVQAANLWEHHHYINPSSHTSYPQPQERYVCTTCRKQFSRPSSLKIHIHSHTGEKPFQCSHAGCGKAFSVRSNMKRHERHCPARLSNVMGGV